MKAEKRKRGNPVDSRGGTIWWNGSKLERFKRATRIAEKTGKEGFIFDGDHYSLPYAQYLMERLEKQLPDRHAPIIGEIRF